MATSFDFILSGLVSWSSWFGDFVGSACDSVVRSIWPSALFGVFVIMSLLIPCMTGLFMVHASLISFSSDLSLCLPILSFFYFAL